MYSLIELSYLKHLPNQILKTAIMSTFTTHPNFAIISNFEKVNWNKNRLGRLHLNKKIKHFQTKSI